MTDNRPQHKAESKWLGAIGLLLAISAFAPYCGLLFIPAAIVSITALLRRSFLAVAIISLIVVLIRLVIASVQLPTIPPGTPAFLYRPYANIAMANYGLPFLPSSTKNIRIFAGGLFAKSVIMVFDATETDVKCFLEKLGGGEINQIGPTGYKLLTYPQENELRKCALAEGRRFDRSRIVHISLYNWIPWYRPDNVEAGWVVHNKTGEEESYLLIYDSRNSRVYFDWHFS
jgi:hypothetical protein